MDNPPIFAGIRIVQSDDYLAKDLVYDRTIYDRVIIVLNGNTFISFLPIRGDVDLSIITCMIQDDIHARNVLSNKKVN